MTINIINGHLAHPFLVLDPSNSVILRFWCIKTVLKADNSDDLLNSFDLLHVL